MDKITEFVENRPEVVAAYAYGSGVFKQTNNNPNKKTQIDLILVVDNLKDWHQKNMKLNKHDYSLMGKEFFKYASEDVVKGSTGIAYISDIKFDGTLFKYGTIEEADLRKHLITWDSFYVPGRMQKPILPVVYNDTLARLIANNRRQALVVASYLQTKDEVTKEDLLTTVCGLSYAGDTRMAYGEKPTKVKDIVNGGLEDLLKIYDFDVDYLIPSDDKYVITKSRMAADLYTLPEELLSHIRFTFKANDTKLIERTISDYFNTINHQESTAQMFKGVQSDGLCKSVAYGLRKVQKRFKK